MMIARWWQDDLIPLVLEHLGVRDLLALETSGALRKHGSKSLERCFRSLGRSTGALSYATREAVGEGRHPKELLLRWHRKRAAFLEQDRASRSNLCAREIALRATGSLAAPAYLEALPCQLACCGRTSVDVEGINRLLPFDGRPCFPLAFGVREGVSSYFGFHFAWEEQGNGEACQIGVNVRTPCGQQSLSQNLMFSPSAGAVFHVKDESRWRAWPLEDLWVDALFRGTRLELDAGIYINERGSIFLYRRGSIPRPTEDGLEELPSWEVTGAFDLSPIEHEAKSREFYIFLSLLDTCTPFQASLVKVTSSPPVRPPSEKFTGWR